MRLPILDFGRGDLDIFESVEHAVRYIEWPTVAVAYDSEGRLLKIEVPGQPATGTLGVKTYSVNKPLTIKRVDNIKGVFSTYA